MRGKCLPHFAAFSKSVAAEARAVNVSRVSMDDTVNVFMVGLSGNVVRCSCLSELVRRVSECVCVVMTKDWMALREPSGTWDFPGTKNSFNNTSSHL